MARLVAVLLAGLISIVAAGDGHHAGASSLGHVCGWHVSHFPKAARINDLASISQPPHQGAWAIAGRVDGNDYSHDVILRWNGRRWSVVRRPLATSALVTVLAVSSRDVWFAGAGRGGFGNNLIEHWNGRRVSVVHGALSTENVQGLAGTRPDSIWLLTYYNESAYLEYWNGSSWSRAKPPDFRGAPAQAISGRSRKDLWAVGGYVHGSGYAAHWNGSNWHHVTDPIFGEPNSNMWAALDLGPRDLWAAGNDEIVHFDGRKWRVTPGPPPNPADWADTAAIAGRPHGPVYAAGSSANAKGTILRWTGKRWVGVHVPLPRRRSSAFFNLSVNAHGEVWAAGDSFKRLPHSKAGDRSLIEHYVPCDPSRRK